MPEVVELYVVMYCESCADSVKRVVKRIPGVESYKIDYVEQKVTVVGNVDREDVWRRIHRTGRYVTLIPKPVPPPKVEEPKKVVEEVVEEEKKKEETKVEKTEETTTIEEKTTEITVEEITIEDTKAVESKEEVKVIEVKEEVATVVETHEDDEEEEEEEEEGDEEEEEEEEEEVVVEMKKEPEKAKPMPVPEWVPMFVTAPYYTLPVPSRFY